MERGGYIPTGYKFDPVVLSAELPWSSTRRGMRCASLNPKERRRMPAKAIGMLLQLMNTADGYAISRHVDKKPLIAASRADSADCGRCARDRGQEDRRGSPGRTNARHRATPRQSRKLKPMSTAERKAQPMQQQAQADAQPMRKRQPRTGASRRSKGPGGYGRKPDGIGGGSHRGSGRCRPGSLDCAAGAAERAQADSDKAAMRAQLSEQLNKILETRDSARGLIVSMSDVLFDTGKYSLKPAHGRNWPRLPES